MGVASSRSIIRAVNVGVATQPSVRLPDGASINARMPFIPASPGTLRTVKSRSGMKRERNGRKARAPKS